MEQQQQQQQNSPTIFIAPDPPPFPAPPRTVDLSPLEFILAILAVIAIPALIYTFFFSIKCPPSLFRRRRSSGHFSDESHQITDEINLTEIDNKERVSSDLKYEKETHVKELGSECPVCLSVFTDGEEVKQLGVCKHSFHSSCIDLWLNSHSNCPVCRASVSTVHPPPPAKQSGSSSSTTTSNTNRSSDFQQGLPDASNLV